MRVSVQTTLFTLFISFLTLTGCQNLSGNKPTIFPGSQPQQNQSEEILINLNELWEQPAYSLVSSITSETNEADARIRRLIAANKLIDNQQIEASRVQLNLINKNQLNSYEQTLIDLAEAKTAFQKKNYSKALSVYQKSSLSDSRLNKLPEGEYVTAQWLKASLYEQNGQILNSALSRIDLAENLTDSEIIEQNEISIWSSLTAIEPSELANATAQNQSYYRQGWLQLAYGVLTQSSPRQAIDDWQMQWSSHPAYSFSSNLLNESSGTTTGTGETTSGYNLPLRGAQRITVLLPMSGRFHKIGNTIINGIKSAPNADQIEFTFLDSEKLATAEDLNGAISEAAANGQELVIGPLMKDKVNMLEASNIPVFALNQAEDENKQFNIFYFSLNPADEARKAAETTLSRGLTRAAVIYLDNPWGENIASEFAQTFTAYGGSVTQIQPFKKSDNLNEMVKEFLKANTTRSQLKESLSNNSVDGLSIQTIYLVGGHEEIRQIKPALNYYYAGAIPVYGISNAYSSFNTYGNRDLRDVCVADIPAMELYLSDGSFADASGVSKPSELRLYSLGRDAVLLAQGITDLGNFSFSESGLTGKLSLNTDNVFTRELDWFTFDQQQFTPDATNKCSGLIAAPTLSDFQEQ